MKDLFKYALLFFLLISSANYAQEKDPVIESIIKEANENSQLERLGHELMDRPQIGWHTTNETSQ